MSPDARFLPLAEAASYAGLTPRWLRRHWSELARDGVTVCRVPRDALKGRLLFERASLDRYLTTCQVAATNSADHGQ
ncbi:MAG: hypothetical protein COV75_06840 [Candidatus Omnitrophica bacterium CG11_big_fil_rev_8_21_14_0_20_63_9]|nr:MAG: hypothetical protein COV75_06840 [Candidatus Omnitrophica bacterium CG11_big_fil_rev_8_21_14_0_20_63_9]